MTPIDKQLAPPGGWLPWSTPKIAPLSVDKMSWPMRALMWGAGKFGKERTGTDAVPDVFLLLLNHQHLFWQWLQFASRLMPFGSLDRGDTEIVILRVGYNCRCRYEWGQHVIIALKEGLTPTEIKAVAVGPDAETWTPRRAALLKAADEIHTNKVLSDTTWRRLTAHFDQGKIIEIILLIGAYEMLAALISSAGLGLEAAAEAQLAEAKIHEGD